MPKPVIIRIEWPAKPLWQNYRCHWGAKSKAVKAQRREACILSQKAKAFSDPKSELLFTFCPPPRSRPDLHNMQATVKGAIDGIADAMKVDDRNFRCVWPDAFGHRTAGGCVLIEIRRSST